MSNISVGIAGDVATLQTLPAATLVVKFV